MTSNDEIDALKSVRYPKKYEPILLANWSGLLPDEEFEKIFERLCQTAYFEKHPLYLSAPAHKISACVKRQYSAKVIFGSYGITSVLENSFTEKTSLKLLKDAGAKFAVLDLKIERALVENPIQEMNKKLQALLSDNVYTFVILGESSSDFLEDRLLDSLKNQIQDLCEGIFPQDFEHFAFIYKSTWAPIQGFSGLNDNLEKSYDLFRQALKEVLGEDSATIRTMMEVPLIFGSSYPYLFQSRYEGYYFPNLELREDSFFKTIEEIESKAPDLLDDKAIF